MNVYLDSSALIPLFITDIFSVRAHHTMQSGSFAVILSDFAATEFSSVIARMVRAKLLTHDRALRIYADFDVWRERDIQQEDCTKVDIVNAMWVLRRLDLPLKAPDAIHIAIAQRLGAALMTFDEQMLRSASVLGVKTISV